jgi:superoxide oxidase
MTSSTRIKAMRICARIHARLPHRRSWLKALHGAMIPLLIWFIIMTPKDVVPLGLFQFHSVLALIFVTISLIWMADYMRRGLAGRPGPKLGPVARRIHWWVHRAIMLGLFGVAITGFLLGLTAPRLLKAGGFLPFAPPLDMRRANDLIGTFHIYEFYLLGVIVAGHAGFHLWRHLRVRDNALRIMAPKVLHRFL